MKKVIIPYVSVDEKWKTGIAVSNRSAHNHVIELIIRGCEIPKTMTVSVPGEGIAKFFLSVEGDLIIDADVPDEINVSAIALGEIEGNQSGFSYAVEKRQLYAKDALCGVSDPDEWEIMTAMRSVFASFTGQLGCHYMINKYRHILYLLVKSIYYSYPDRASRKTIIGDGSGFKKKCPDHPGQSHSDGTTFDAAYYGAGTIREIMTDGYGRLSPKFDMERNAAFYGMIKKVFPRAQVHVHADIERAMVHYNDALKHVLVPDSRFNHDSHVHIILGSEIDMEAAI